MNDESNFEYTAGCQWNFESYFSRPIERARCARCVDYRPLKADRVPLAKAERRSLRRSLKVRRCWSQME